MTGFSFLFSFSFVLSTLLVFCHTFWVTNDNQIKKNSKTPAQVLSELNIKRDNWPYIQSTHTTSVYKGRPTVTSFWREPGAPAPRPTQRPTYEAKNGYNLWEGMEFSYSSGDPSELQLIPMYSYNRDVTAAQGLSSRDFSLDSQSNEESTTNQLVLPRYGYIHPWLSPIMSRPVYESPRPNEEIDSNIVDAMVGVPSKKVMADNWLKTTPNQTEAVPQFNESIDQKPEDTNDRTKRQIDFNQEFSMFRDQDFSDISIDFNEKVLTDDSEPHPLYAEGSASQWSTEFSFEPSFQPPKQSPVPIYGPFMPRPVYAPPRPIEAAENKTIDAIEITPSKNGETDNTVKTTPKQNEAVYQFYESIDQKAEDTTGRTKRQIDFNQEFLMFRDQDFSDTPKQTEAVPQFYWSSDQKLEDMTDNSEGKADLNRDFSLNRDQVFRDISNDFKYYSKQELTDIYDKIFNTKYPINDIV